MQIYHIWIKLQNHVWPLAHPFSINGPICKLENQQRVSALNTALLADLLYRRISVVSKNVLMDYMDKLKITLANKIVLWRTITSLIHNPIYVFLYVPLIILLILMEICSQELV